MVKALALFAVGAAASDFEEYMNKFGKVYNGEDEISKRKGIYEENMKFIEAENAKGNSWTLGETQFTDLTNEEFKTLYVSGYKPASQMLGDLPYLGEHVETESTGSVDWTTKGAVTPVKNQGQCGSCWSFSTTGGIEGAWEISTGNLVSLSEQQFVDCDKSSMGCNGGNMGSAIGWAEKQNLATEASYPYKAVDGTCKSSFTTGIPQGGVTGYKSVGGLFSKATVTSLESAIDIGPVSIAIEADQSSFQHYTGGVLSSGCGTNLDHGVLAVGYNTAEGYWLVKNSWGASWGDNGYIKLAQEGNVCGILNQPVYPTVSGSVEALADDLEGNRQVFLAGLLEGFLGQGKYIKACVSETVKSATDVKKVVADIKARNLTKVVTDVEKLVTDGMADLQACKQIGKDLKPFIDAFKGVKSIKEALKKVEENFLAHDREILDLLEDELEVCTFGSPDAHKCGLDAGHQMRSLLIGDSVLV